MPVHASSASVMCPAREPAVARAVGRTRMNAQHKWNVSWPGRAGKDRKSLGKRSPVNQMPLKAGHISLFQKLFHQIGPGAVGHKNDALRHLDNPLRYVEMGAKNLDYAPAKNTCLALVKVAAVTFQGAKASCRLVYLLWHYLSRVQLYSLKSTCFVLLACWVLRLVGYTLGSRRLAKKTLNQRLKSSTNV